MKLKMTFYLIVCLFCLPFTGSITPPESAAQAGKLNVLFIAVDDLRPELGCYGNSLIKTPNIDRLATAGVRFDVAYCQYPLCNPSRTSLFTGRHPTVTGVLDNRTWFRAAHPDWVTLPQHFKANGYASLRTGKQFHGGIDDTEAWTEGDLFIRRDASEAEACEVIRAYWASTTFTDFNVGRVLAALDRLKLREKTIIVFWGDHGYHLGEKGKWSKHNSLYEVGTRVPLIMAVPNTKQAGKSSPRTVQLLDMYPTLVELCGLPMPAGQQGHSLAPLLKNPTAKWDHAAYTVTKFQNKLGKAVRTERWRYTEWEDGSAMLFDHTKDPHELKNLADDPAQAKVVKEMKALLAQLPK